MPQRPLELSIVIPTYNEKNRFPGTLEAYLSFFDSTGMDYEIIFADLSSDGSKDLIKECQRKHGNIVLLDINKRGKGLAIYEAFKIGRGRFLSFTDADNSTSPEEFYRLFRSMEGCDAAIGSREMKQSNVEREKESAFKRVARLVHSLLFVKLLYGLDIKDTQCGAKVFRREKVLAVLPEMRINNAIFDVELLWRLKKSGCVIKEVPIKWVDSRFTRFGWRDYLEDLIWLARVRMGM